MQGRGGNCPHPRTTILLCIQLGRSKFWVQLCWFQQFKAFSPLQKPQGKKSLEEQGPLPGPPGHLPPPSQHPGHSREGGQTKLAVSCQCSGEKPQRNHPSGLVTHRTKPKPSVPAHSRLLPAWGPACPELSRLSKDHLIVVYETSHCADAGGGNGVPHRLVIPTDVTSPPCCAAQWGPGYACFSQGDLSQTCNDFPGKSPALLPLHSHPMLEPANGFPKELTCSRVLCPGQPRRDESLIFGKCCKFTWMGRECRITLAPSFPPSLYASRLAPLNSLLLLAINCTWWKVTPQSNFSKKCS